MHDDSLHVVEHVADDKSLIIAVGYMLRSSPAVVAAKQLMEEVKQTISPVSSVTWHFLSTVL